MTVIGALILLFGAAIIGYGVYHLMYPKKGNPTTPQTRVDAVQAKSGPHQTRWEARKEQKASAARAGAANQLAEEARATNDLVEQQTELVAKQFALDNEEERQREQRSLEQIKSENEGQFYLRATEEGTTPEILTEKQRALIDVEKHLQLSNIDLEARWKEILQDSNAADLALIGDHLVIKKLRQELIEARRERHTIRNSDEDEDLKRELLADYDKFILRLEAKIDERETGHLLPADGEAPKRLTEGKDDSRADYPSETDEDYQ